MERKEKEEVGTKRDAFRELLFADQGLGEIVELSSAESTGPPEDPWTLFAKAHEALRAGVPKRAKGFLKRILGLKGLETRLHLWAWNALRELGEGPPPGEGEVVRGVIIEMPLKNGTDTLAAYADGTARYINQSGKIIVWDRPDEDVPPLCRKVLSDARPLLPKAVPTPKYKPMEKGNCRVTLLTFNGNRSFETASGDLSVAPVLSRGLALMQKLMYEAYKKQN